MDDVLNRLLAATADMLQRIRTAEFEELEAFVAERGKLVEQLTRLREQGSDPAPYTAQVQALLSADKRIHARMAELRDEAAAQLRKLNAGGMQKLAYESPYANESVFIDRKK